MRVMRIAPAKPTANMVTDMTLYTLRAYLESVERTNWLISEIVKSRSYKCPQRTCLFVNQNLSTIAGHLFLFVNKSDRR